MSNNKSSVTVSNLSLSPRELNAKFKELISQAYNKHDPNQKSQNESISQQSLHFNKNNIYHCYFDIADLKKALSSSKYITQYNIYNDIIDIICEYAQSSLNWSDTDKSDLISFYNSADNHICYAINEKTNHCGQLIFLNQSIDVIDINNIDAKTDKYIFRYLFKYYENPNNNAFVSSSLGIISTDCDIPNKFSESRAKLAAYQTNTALRWWYGSDKITNAKNGPKPLFDLSIKADLNSSGDIESYILLEIDFLKQLFIIYSFGFQNNSKSIKLKIPTEMFENQPLRIMGRMYGIGDPQCVGFGLVKVNIA